MREDWWDREFIWNYRLTSRARGIRKCTWLLSSLACLFPFGAWLFHLLDHFSLLLSFICSTSIVLSLYVLFLTIHQIYLVTKCQTWHEYGRNIRLYTGAKDLQSNLGTVFGKRWYLVLFSPLVNSPPMGDGMAFETNTGEPGYTRRSGQKQIWMLLHCQNLMCDTFDSSFSCKKRSIKCCCSFSSLACAPCLRPISSR